MKKIILSFTCFLIAFTAISQELEFGFKAGLSKGGFTYSNFTANTVKYSPTNENISTYNFGAYGRLKLWVIGLYVQPELMYNKRGSNVTLETTTDKYIFSNTANYLEIPVLVGFKMLKTFRIYGGPNFQIMTKQKTDIPNAPKFASSDLTKKTTGIQLGLGLDLMKLRFDVKYDFNAGNMGTPFLYDGSGPSAQNTMLTFQIGYKLFGVL
ncbi:MAG: PorT family protein [Bacteroidia bacterium]|nr:PorT family protein [Bacteroidia bacterium]MCF8426766.1 PorT family protein [Bacteroidia bacterium]MCF8445558.1 PorT family protein [Bacteroidia bacterium]